MSEELLHLETELRVADLDDAAALALLQEILGVSLAEARFILAIERGEITGDVVKESDGLDVSEAEQMP